MLKECEKLLDHEWSVEEKEILERVIKNLKYYNTFMTKTTKQDIGDIVRLAIKLKTTQSECTCILDDRVDPKIL